MKTTIHVTIDRDTKQKAQRLAEELGLDISTVVRASLRQFIRTESFLVEKTYRMTPYLEEIIADAKANPNAVFGPFKTTEEAVEFLDAGKWK